MSKRNKPSHPPGWAMNFLNWFCPDDILEGVVGDMLEDYKTDIAQRGNGHANRRFILNVFRLFHPYIIFRNNFKVSFMNPAILVSYAKVAIRSMRNNLLYSSINLTGLSIAIAFAFLSFQFMASEMSYDKFHTKGDRIYRLYHKIIDKETHNVKNISAVTAIPLSKDLKESVSSVHAYTRVASSTITVHHQNQPFEELVHFADPGFLEMFDYPYQGNGSIPLDKPHTVVLSNTKAKQFFGVSDPIGKTLFFSINDQQKPFDVIGIIDPKSNQSSISFDFVLPMASYKEVVGEESFNSYRFGLVENYILCEETMEPAMLSGELTQAIQPFITKGEDRFEIGVQSLPTIHLDDDIVGNAAFVSPLKLYIISTLAFLVLLIAIINYITLSTSHVIRRYKEVTVRTVMGALPRQVWGQMFSESILMTSIAGLTGLGLSLYFLPMFSVLIGSEIPFALGLKEALFMILTVILLATINGGLQSNILKKHLRGLKTNENKALNVKALMHNGLLVTQFGLSILLIIGAMVIRSQMNYIQNKELGFDEERLIELKVPVTSNSDDTRQLLKRTKVKLAQHPNIVGVAATMNNAREPWTKLMFDQQDGPALGIYFNLVDVDYLDIMDIELLDGEGFKRSDQGPSNAILVNQALINEFGWSDFEEKQIPGKAFTNDHQIVGVVQDYHFSSLHESIEPLIIATDINSVRSGVTGLSTYVWPPGLYQILVRIGPGDLISTMNDIEKIWHDVSPNEPFVYHFVDSALDSKYADEARWAKVMNFASLFALLVAWLGLFGLMRLSIEKRMKEIGIRKVLGASTSSIVSMLSWKYIRLIIIGMLISFPIGWVITQRWLNTFSYRIESDLSLYLMAGFSVLVLALGSMVIQTMKAGRSNPIESIKVE